MRTRRTTRGKSAGCRRMSMSRFAAENKEERARLARLFEQGITAPVGCVLPLRRVWWANTPHWESGEWVVRSEEMFLIPGDSPMGFRLPIQSLLWTKQSALDLAGYTRDGFAERPALAAYHQMRERAASTATTVTRQFSPAAVGGPGGGDFGDAGYDPSHAPYGNQTVGNGYPGIGANNGDVPPLSAMTRTQYRSRLRKPIQRMSFARRCASNLVTACCTFSCHLSIGLRTIWN